MPDYYYTHLRKTSDPTLITKPKLERGMVVKMKYKKDKETKLYIVFVLQPKWPKTADGKLHCLSLNVIPPNKVLEIAQIYDEVMAPNSNLPKIQINEASKVFYTSEIKTKKLLRAGYRTFDLKKIQSLHAVNYDWGKYDKVSDRNERKEQEEKEAQERKEKEKKEARERKEQEENKKTK